MTNYFMRKFKVRAQAGQNFGACGRRTAGSTAGVKTTANVRRGSGIISRSCVKVSEFLTDQVSSQDFMLYIADHHSSLIKLEKRAAAQKAEIDFFALLKESGIAKAGAVWKEVSQCYIYRITLANMVILTVTLGQENYHERFSLRCCWLIKFARRAVPYLSQSQRFCIHND